MNDAWCNAVRSNDITTVKSLCLGGALLDANVDVNLTDEDGFTALILAASGGHTKVVELLCKRDDIEVNKSSWSGYTALTFAASGGHTEIVELLCRRDDVEINKSDASGDTALTLAAWEGHTEIVELLCRRDDVEVNKSNVSGDTALTFAACGGYTEIVELLCKRDDVEVNKTTERGDTALILAASGGYTKVMQVLCRRDDIAVNMRNKKGDIALHCAVRNRHSGAAIIRFLSNVVGVRNIKNDAGKTPFRIVAESEDLPISFLLYLYKLPGDDTITGNQQYRDGKTLLHIAAEDNNDEEVEHLLSRYSDLDVNVRDDRGNAPLHCAIRKGHLATVTILCSKKLINVSMKNNRGESPLDIAINTNNCTIVLALCKVIDKDDIINKKYTINGETLLHLAVRTNNKEVLEHFSKVPGVLNVENNAGYTPFRLVAKCEDFPLTSLLYLYKLPGADANNVNKQYRGGKTLLHIAVEDDNSEEIEHMISKYPDLDVNVKDDQEYTPLHYAVLRNQINTVKVLCSKNTIEINVRFNGEESDDMTPLLIHAIQNKYIRIAVFLLTQSTIDVDVNDEKGNGVFHILYNLVIAIELSRPDITSADTEVISSLKSDYLTENMRSPKYEVPEILRELLQHEKPVLKFLREKCNDSNISEELKQILSAILNVIVIGLQKYADNNSLRYAFFKGSLYKTLIQIFLDKSETNAEGTNCMIHIIQLIYMSLQARNPCDETEKDFIKDSLDAEIFIKFRNKISKLAWMDMSGECSDIQLLARNIYNVYLKKEKGCLSDIKNCLEKLDKCVFKLECSLRLCHYCIERGCLALLICIFGIYLHASDIISDAMVGVTTLHGFSRELGIFMIVIVVFNLLHENIRSVIALYDTEKELLRVKLGKFKLEKSDWYSGSDLNYSEHWHKNMFYYWICPFRVQTAKTLLLKAKAFMFNVLSTFMLRPIVDRLIILVHSPSNIRTVYRQKSKRMSLNQYFLILEQMPELLIQFYLFQIYFNNIEASDHPKCLEGSMQSFSYNPAHFQCTTNFLGMNMCVPWILIYSMAIPFFKIPKSMVSLEEMFRKLDPMTPMISSAAKFLFYLAYIMMIPSRLFLFAGMMHAASNHFIVIGYIIVTSFIWLMVNMIKFKGYKFIKIVNFTRMEVIKKVGDFLLLYLFSCRDVLVISLRDPKAYMSKPSEVKYHSLRIWKKLMLISIFYFIENLIGAVYIEHYYPCGMYTEIFKYQGWVWLVLQIFSSTLLILLSYVLQPQLLNIIPIKFNSKSVHIFTFGLVMCLFATIAFFLSNSRSLMAKTIATTVVFSCLLLLFVVAITSIKHFGEAKKKKEVLVEEEEDESMENESNSRHSCCSRLCFSCPFATRSNCCTTGNEQEQVHQVQQVQVQPDTDIIEMIEHAEEQAKETSPLVRRSDVHMV